METDAGRGCVQPDVVLLAEFRGWLDRERGLSPVSVQCYSKQSKACVTGIGGSVLRGVLGREALTVVGDVGPDQPGRVQVGHGCSGGDQEVLGEVKHERFLGVCV